FTVAVHFATALSTLVVYRAEVTKIARGLLQGKNNDEFKFSAKIILSMIPAAAIGVLFADQLEHLFDRQIILVGLMLWLTGFLLLIADKAKATTKDVNFKHSILIGIAQAIAILPGISRSGATISTSVLLGIDRNKAASFSFLMAVPIILGKVAKDLFDGGVHISSDQSTVLAVGFLTAFVTGLFVFFWMIKLVRNAQLKYFSYYCFCVGSAAIFHEVFM
ncbi:MAG: undecaprenyl-diphosphate phosphatase, partial [Porticoccaceae bacterium]|nr:undecaprenyl-diphosphate phosphatase [Porticoccaceae bacterium]